MAGDRNRAVGDTKDARDLALYGYPQCPFCRRVLDAAESLDLDLPLRDTRQNADRHRELVDAMGRSTVPVLRIEGPSGEIEWLPESADIVRYLETRFREGGSGSAAR